jgi:hypothetical protein
MERRLHLGALLWKGSELAGNFVIRWPGLDKQVRCGGVDLNHEILEWWVEQLPIKAVQTHTLVSGSVLSTLVVRTPAPYTWDLGTEATEDSRFVPDGRIKIKRHNVAGVVQVYVKYGPRTEDLQDISFAQVWEEDLPTLYEVGAEVWKAVMQTKKVIFVEFATAEWM